MEQRLPIIRIKIKLQLWSCIFKLYLVSLWFFVIGLLICIMHYAWLSFHFFVAHSILHFDNFHPHKIHLCISDNFCVSCPALAGGQVAAVLGNSSDSSNSQPAVSPLVTSVVTTHHHQPSLDCHWWETGRQAQLSWMSHNKPTLKPRLKHSFCNDILTQEYTIWNSGFQILCQFLLENIKLFQLLSAFPICHT